MKTLHKVILTGLLVLVPVGLFAYSGGHYKGDGHNNHNKFEHFNKKAHHSYKNVSNKDMQINHIHDKSHMQTNHLVNEGEHIEPKSHLNNN